MKIFGLGLLIVGISAMTLGAQTLQWETSYTAAFKKAQQSGKTVLVLITAPSWCYWCQEFDKKVLSSAKVQSALAAGFVPLKVLDTSADLGRFSFDGYPTVRIYDKKGAQVKDVYTLNPESFVSLIQKYAVSDAKPVAASPSPAPKPTNAPVAVTKGPAASPAPAVSWRELLNVFQYGEADWSNEIRRETNLTLDQAKAIAAADPRITYFCYTVGGRLVLPPLGSLGVFDHGDTVFFSGKPWYGSAPQLGNAYEKVSAATEPATPVKYLYEKGYFQKLEDGLWQGCDNNLCRSYKEDDSYADDRWIVLKGFVPEYNADTTITIPTKGGQAYYYNQKKQEWARWYKITAPSSDPNKLGVVPNFDQKPGAAPLVRQEPKR